ncbi:phosphorylcholine transferase LicD [Eubacteriales bacterium KG127]
MVKYEISEKDTLRMQKIGLDMVKSFDVFCKRNDLKYFLCGGCCIGAIRGKGFIPWDDDVDIFMMRKDFERLKILWENTDKYEIQYNQLNKPSYSTILTIHDKETTFIKNGFHDRDVSQGVAMDIFPLDYAPSGFKRKIQLFWAIVFSIYSVSRAPANHGTLIKLAGNILLGIIPSKKMRYKVSKFAESKMSKYKEDECANITELCAGPHYMKNNYEKDIFNYSIYVDFEDTKLPIPQGYHRYLTKAFGDYMTLPPIEARKNHHPYEFMDLDTPYAEYKGDKYYKK